MRPSLALSSHSAVLVGLNTLFASQQQRAFAGDLSGKFA